MKDDNFILINEVGLRDGLQGVSQEVTIEQRLKIIDILIESGLKNIQVCSFVNPKKIPQMNNVEELVKKLPKKNDVSFSAFILNQYGLERALKSGIKKVETSISLSESYSQKNVGISVAKAQENLHPIVSEAIDAKVEIRAGLQCVWGCAYEGKINSNKVLKLLEEVINTGASVICLADTIGAATPHNIENLLEKIFKQFPDIKLALHLHVNNGVELDNVKIAIEMGINQFDTSFGGIGGSPFMKGSRGNIATEEMVDHLNRLGYTPGIVANKVATASRILEEIINSEYFYGELYKLANK